MKGGCFPRLCVILLRALARCPRWTLTVCVCVCVGLCCRPWRCISGTEDFTVSVLCVYVVSLVCLGEGVESRYGERMFFLGGMALMGIVFGFVEWMTKEEVFRMHQAVDTFGKNSAAAQVS